MFVSVLRIGFCLSCLVLAASAYIPAVATNKSDAINAGVNESDTSMLQLQWFPNASYSETVFYQLVGADSTGINKGALVHFSEWNLTNDTTTTPWIALVSCDFNASDASMEDDIFTLARDRGAVAALLYSQWSQACLINEEYADPATFDQVFDIFSTKLLTSARTVENAFTNVNQSLYGDYNPVVLNRSASIINESIETGKVLQAGYLFATLTANNATIPDNNSGSGGGQPSASSSSSSNTDLAMIVLYVITGAVSFLFCIVILSGAIRAIRHPERYGPRAADPTMGEFGGGQSRARGLTRAILDTFPVMKFSARPPENGRSAYFDNAKFADVETHSSNDRPINLPSRVISGAQGDSSGTNGRGANRGDDDAHIVEVPRSTASTASNDDVLRDTIFAEERLRTSSPGAGPSSPTSFEALSNAPDRPSSNLAGAEAPVTRLRESSTHEDQARDSMVQNSVVPEAIGRDTCPICIVDFEEGDDIRVLPCEGHHVFHQTCVDPWLLELSSSCPICRQDFLALEEMIAGSTEGHDEQSHVDDVSAITAEHRTSNSHVGARYRFSRYLRFARGRRGHYSHRPWGNRDSVVDDTTDPPLPTVSDGRL